MKIENDYPKIKSKVNKFLIFRRITLILFLISIIVCLIVNLSIGGKKWVYHVILGEIIFYYAFLNKPLIDNTLVKRISIVLMIVCIYLYVIDWIDHTSWSYFVINIILFSMILFQLLLFLTAIGSIIFCILAITKVFKINWAVIVFGSLGLASLLMLLIFYREMITSELKKYFSVK